MNICFVFGKIISEINFEFIINNKNISIAYFYLELKSNTIIKIIGYDGCADFCFRKLKINDLIFIEGFLNNKYEIIINNIKLI